ncbi:hypothetical protein L6164_010529 [Bauhinia variegata]|uniref:Uncharacterized protein n=1 Tax=Bauhinia variegata TaxID=167791 RepID=A0ACB9PN65_BAUVA|nr:hypothetical protein L6164_010529 [Bauhinia variegata]
MGSQIPTCSDRLRTNWTPVMERYFIDLLLDHVHRGNRMGRTFNKNAWNEMLTLFNAKIGYPCDINVLKSRYTIFLMLFNDIKNLLDQAGFSWDATKQMVIANDHVWDAYIKANPNSQSYRNKVLVNFDDLCLICAHTSADGRYSLSSHDVDFEDDVQGVNTGIAANTQAPFTRDCPNTDWTLSMDGYFIKLMLDEIKKGNKIHERFNRKAWENILKLFNKKFHSQYDKSFLKHRYKKLRNYYTDVKDLLQVKGFSWDEKQQRIVADNQAWNNYIKAHPHAISYGKKTLLNYRDLGLIYEHAVSNGHCSHLQEGKKLYAVCRNEISEGRYSHSACSEDLNGHGPVLIMDHDISGYSRTDWTPSMDRFLIDLMLDEVQRGDKIDYAYNSKALIDMLILFKERFGVQFDVDFLKSCCKDLEMLYHDMRSLLEQRGFSWDETQQMIRACDDVWNTYIKDHPDANSYRNKRKPNYNDLCLIYENSDSHMEYNLAGQDVGYSCNGDWTPSMDRYFIDLMLEEVRNESMVDHKFQKLAWKNMVGKFSSRFGTRYDKDVLESRFMILRERFNDMKILLDRNGFTWDEKRQMVIADDRLWDAYVKEHCDVKTYRNRSLPNLNDLFLIFGRNNCGRNQNYSSYSSYAKDNEMRAGGDEYNQSPANSDPSKLAWTVKMDCYLIGLVLEQLNRGNVGDIFGEKGWARMTASFNEEFRFHCDEDTLGDRFFGLVKVYKDLTYLFNQNGIAWDVLHSTRANEVWKAFFEENPDAIAYGQTVVDNYSEFCLIFDHLKQNRRCDSPPIKRQTSNSNFWTETIGTPEDLESSAGRFIISGQRRKRKSKAQSTSLYGRKVQSLKGEIQDLQEKQEVVKTTIKKENYNSIESVVAALHTVPDMDDELFLEACVLLEDERKAKMFVAMDVASRRKWLLKKLSQ